MRWLVVVLCACGAPAATPRDATIDPDAAIEIDAPPDAPDPVAIIPGPGIHAPHGGQISALAVTDDGATAITCERTGATRLWPALDGTREPVVVPRLNAVQLAIAHNGARFAVAAVDSAGTLEILQVLPNGDIAARATHATRPIVAVAATTTTLIAETDDQVLLLFSLDGTRRARLVAKPGERITAIAHRRDAAIAMIAGEARHGRWIEPTGWGVETPPLAIDPSPIVLSPDGKQLAGTSKGLVVLVDPATGRRPEGFALDNDPQSFPIPVGYIDATHLAVEQNERLAFHHAGASTPLGEQRDGDFPVAVDGMIVSASAAVLAIGKPSGTKYLGYRVHVAQDVRALEHGFMISDGTRLVRTDAQLAQRASYFVDSHLSQRIPLDAHTAIAKEQSENAIERIVAVDLDDGTRTQLLYGSTNYVQYQPDTRLWAAVSTGHVYVGRFTGHGFEGPVDIPLAYTVATRYEVPRVDLPERGSLVTIVEAVSSETETTTAISALDFARGSATISALGTGPRTEEDPQVPMRSTHGPLVAEIHGERITLTEHGTLRWTIAARGATQLVWTPSGELVAAGTGLAYVDLATGALRGKRCGWDFALSSESPEFSNATETLCDD